MKKQICLGSAQFGLDYGITNNNGKITQSEIEKILEMAICSNIKYIDTASAYGNAEKLIGSFARKKNFKIISKFPSQLELEYSKDNIKKWDAIISKTLSNLGISKLDSYLVHDIKDLKKKNSDILIHWLKSLVKRGIVDRIGISIYEKKDISDLDISDFKIVQLPLSIYDQRLLSDGTIDFLNSRGISIHVRSIFLQGLILSHEKNWPEFISNSFKNHHKRFREYSLSNEKSLLDNALDFIFNVQNIESCLVGVCSEKDLKEISLSWENLQFDNKSNFKKFEWNSIKDIDPRLWN